MHIEQLYKQYSNLIQNYLNRFVNKEDAQDLTQEVFAKVHANRDKYRGDSSIKTWIYSIAANTAKDYLRSKSYKAYSRQVEITEIDLKKYDDLSIPEKLLEDEIDTDRMSECISEFIIRLPHNYSSILVLKEFEGLSLKEISGIFDITVSTVKVRLYRARARLKDELEQGCIISTDCDSRLTCERKVT
ncbi:MAG: RNA polymerase sigma factor [Sedimenticola sp.]